MGVRYFSMPPRMISHLSSRKPLISMAPGNDYIGFRLEGSLAAMVGEGEFYACTKLVGVKATGYSM